MDQETKRYLDRINDKLSLLVEAQKKETWVNGSWVIDLTGFTKEQMRSARMQGIIKYKKSKEKTYKYLVESIPPQFLKKQTA